MGSHLWALFCGFSVGRGRSLGGHLLDWWFFSCRLLLVTLPLFGSCNCASCLLSAGFSRRFFCELCGFWSSFFLLLLVSFFFSQWEYFPVVSLVFFGGYGLSRGVLSVGSLSSGTLFFFKKAFTREFLTLVSFGLWALRVSFLAGSSSYVLSVAFAGA